MTEKHTYIKKLYKENILWLRHELNKIENITNHYKQELKENIWKFEEKRINEVIQYNEKLLKFIKRVKYMLYKKLK